MPIGKKLSLRLPLLMLAMASLSCFFCVSCKPTKTSIHISRERLFTLSYGPAEDQLDLFQLENAAGPLKTRITMREGLFYIGNGNGAKVVRFSSFGDVLSMIYNPETSPEPLFLKQTTTEQAGGQRASQYPFRAIGELAVDSRQVVYVEDRLPSERRVFDKDSNSMLDYVVLRFDKDGQFLDYLEQEGVGGTPFPYIVGIYTTSSDDSVIVSMTQSSWFVHWFDSKGLVRHVLKLRRDALPQPAGETNLIASLDRIVPDSNGKQLILKADYYKEAVDASTKSPTGIEYASSWAYRMDPATAEISDRWEIPAEEKLVKEGPEGDAVHYVRIPEFVGMAGDRLFFITADDEGRSSLSIYDTGASSLTRYVVDIEPEELYYSTLYLSPEGILSALLGTKYEARVVWWRFDKLLGASAKEKKD